MSQILGPIVHMTISKHDICSFKIRQISH